MGKTLADLQSNISISAQNAVTGDIEFCTGYTGFSDDIGEQAGWYLALKVSTSAQGSALEGATITATYAGTVRTLEDGETFIIRLAEGENSITFAANKEGYSEGRLTLDLSGLQKELVQNTCYVSSQTTGITVTPLQFGDTKTLTGEVLYDTTTETYHFRLRFRTFDRVPVESELSVAFSGTSVGNSTFYTVIPQTGEPYSESIVDITITQAMINNQNPFLNATVIPVGGSAADIFYCSLSISAITLEQFTLTGTLPLSYIGLERAPLENYDIYGTSEGAGVETENLVTQTIQGATINSAGTLVTSSTFNASIAPITVGTTYTLLRDYNYAVGTTHYAFFANLPVKGSTSYDGNRETSSELSVTITAPITGYVVLLNKENKATVAEGSIAIPYGYKIPLTITSGKPSLVTNIIDNAYVNSRGILTTNSSLNAAITPIERNKTYTILKETGNSNMFCGFFETYPVMDANTYDGSRVTFETEYYTFTAPITGYLVSSCASAVTDPIVYEGEYHPRESVEIPLYIGDSKLGENEYIDYQEQKIYKNISETLTPIDPPAPLPPIVPYKGDNILSSSETVGNVELTGLIKATQ